MFILGYWNIKGRMEEIRLLMAYFNVQYQEQNPDSPDQWFNEMKFNMGLPFPNLPYLIDGDFKLTQSQTILKYLVEKYGNKQLFGKTQLDQIKVTQVKGVVYDVFIFVSTVCVSNQSLKQYENGIMNLEKKLTYLCRYLKDKEYLMGYITVADFAFILSIESLNKLQKTLKKDLSINKHQNLKDHLNKMKNLPGIKEYYENDKRSKNPIFMHVLAKIKI